MKKIITTINIIIAIYFLFLAILCFLGGVIGLTLSNEELPGSRWPLVIDLVFAPLLIYGSIIFFREIKGKYLYGLIILGIIWLETQIYRLFFITNGKFEGTDLSNLLFFGVPFAVILLAKYLDKKLIKINLE